MTQKIWLITGCSKGLGRVLAEAVIAAGDCLVATAREVATLAPLVALAPTRVLALALDVNDEAAAHAAVAATQKAFGRLDVLVNNAGYGLSGAVEEVSDAEAREQMETNVFGVLKLCRAALPIMRAQRSGHILQISSVAGFVATPGLGIYNASKFALEGFSEALAMELAPLGIHLTIIQPGPFRTDWASTAANLAPPAIADYAQTAGQTRGYLLSVQGKQAGDPQKAAAAMLAVVNAAKPPLRLPLGDMAVGRIRTKLTAMEAELKTWEAVSRATSFASE